MPFYAAFSHGEKKKSADGFYDGDGNYVVRFMPTEEGEWKYTTYSPTEALNGTTGSFICTKPVKNNHGPVKVNDA
ncbi:DUF5060 domain-containing protein [Flavitalea antarctica]